jgi:hypothetical protein
MNESGAADAAASGGGVLAGLSTAKVAAAVVAGLVVIGAAAGAVYLYQQDDGPVDLSGVPEDVDSVTYVDVDQLRQDPAVARLVDAALPDGESDEVPEDYEELQAEFESETGLDLANLHSFVSYGTLPAEGATNGSEYAGTLLRTDWSGEAVAEAYADAAPGDVAYERGEYGGRTVYRPSGTSGTGAPPTWVAVLEEDRLVTGTPAAVRDAVDVANGDAAAFGGELKTAFRDARGGYVKTASRVPGSRVPSEEVSVGGGDLDVGPFQDLEIVTAAYYVEGNAAGAQLSLYATDESAADDVRDLLVGAVSLASATVEAEDVESALREIDVERDGDRVDVSFEKRVDDLTGVIQALREGVGDEDGSTGDGDTATGSASLAPEAPTIAPGEAAISTGDEGARATGGT